MFPSRVERNLLEPLRMREGHLSELLRERDMFHRLVSDDPKHMSSVADMS